MKNYFFIFLTFYNYRLGLLPCEIVYRGYFKISVPGFKEPEPKYEKIG